MLSCHECIYKWNWADWAPTFSPELSIVTVPLNSLVSREQKEQKVVILWSGHMCCA